MIIVSGMPRSGTSLMMRLLFFLDIPVTGKLFPKFRDKQHNPDGYYEDGNHLSGFLDDVDHSENFGVKVNLRQLIENVTPDPTNHKIIFCYRNVNDMTTSQLKTDYAPDHSFDRCKIQNQKWYGKIDDWVGSTPHLKVNLDDLKANKSAGVAAIKSFLSADRDTTKAESIIKG
jgi:hypothetical protein